MSNAKVDLPEPLTPVTTVRALRGISISRSLRLFCLAPRMWMHLPFSGRGVTEDCSGRFSLPGNTFIASDTFPLEYGGSASRRSDQKFLLCREKVAARYVWRG